MFRYFKIAFCLGFVLCFVDANSQEIKRSDSTNVRNDTLFYVHKVKAGNTVYNLSGAYKVSQDIILQSNPSAKTGIKLDSYLYIPHDKNSKAIVSSTAPEIEARDESKYEYIIVKKRQTLFSISKKHKVSVEQVLAANPIIRDIGLREGAEIRIPIPQKEAPKAVLNPQLIAQINQLRDSTITNDTGNLDTTIVHKDIYNIAVLLPLHYELNDSLNRDLKPNEKEVIPRKTLIALEFLEGLKLAADSLNQAGFNSQLFVYDTKSDSSTIQEILHKKEFPFMNLIIGPLQSANLDIVASFADTNGIHMVSPLSKNEEFLTNHKNVSKVRTGFKTQLSNVTNYVASKYPKKRIVFVYGKYSKEALMIDELIAGLKSKLMKGGTDSSLVANVMDVPYSFGQYGSIRNQLASSDTTIILFFSNDLALVIDAITKLSRESKKNVIVFGMENWGTERFESLEIDYLHKLNVHIPASIHVNYCDSVTNQLLSSYRTSYDTDPLRYSLIGFDVGWYYFSLLKGYGTNLSMGITAKPFCGMSTVFSYQPNPANRFENTYTTIYRFENFQRKKVN